MSGKQPTKTMQKIYRRRIKESQCRKKGPAVCRSKPGCKYVSTKKRNYCRKRTNRVKTAKVSGKSRRRRQVSKRKSRKN